ncbi:MAG: hypothetical protein KBC06_02410 [Candidatus Pacebacteria bacterium]|nr:hypothetical protein [Candidatus Paceibacterota bacterium]
MVSFFTKNFQTFAVMYLASGLSYITLNFFMGIENTFITMLGVTAIFSGIAVMVRVFLYLFNITMG